MKLAWGQNVRPVFVETLLQVCRRLNWTDDDRPSWLMSSMAFETGESFSPTVRNGAGSGAIGLIQFMPTTARSLGTTTEALAGMTAEEQLLMVERYFAPYANRIHTLSDLYMAILLPKYIGAAEDAVLFSGGIAYRQNAGLDADRDGQIIKAEAAGKVRAKYLRGMEPGRVLDVPRAI